MLRCEESRSDQATLCIALMAQATQKMQENLDQSRKDPMRSLKHYEMTHTNCVTWMGVSYPAHGIFAISRDAIFRRGYGPHMDTFAL
nr:hypothetical protein [Tanacetum cinerariifolium]